MTEDNQPVGPDAGGHGAISATHDRNLYPLTILDVVTETVDTKSFVLGVPSHLADTFAYVAGQFCTFSATIGGRRVARSYSMSSAPEVDPDLKTTVKRVPGGVMSNWMNEVLSPGDTVEVMRPTGNFVLRPTGAPLVAFAGGSGITPVIAIIKSALVTTDRAIRLVYANRNRAAVIFSAEIDRLASAWPDRLSVYRHLDSDGGFLSPSACAALVDGCSEADMYICGPAAYMDTVEAGLSELGINRERIFIERFFVEPDQGAAALPSETETLVVRLERRRKTIPYQQGDTILEAARRGGLTPPFSCEGGSCATCMAHIDAGEARMRVNNALTVEEVNAGWILTCQAMPLTPQVSVSYD